MKEQEFTILVKRMRKQQKIAYNNPTFDNMQLQRLLERKVDTEIIKRENGFYNQTNIFPDDV